ncbi:MAG: phosphoribosylglycinamide formyltransferase [Candidatus Omnitrophica bacterium]|nr:phosphoribosylglycinamide formyltransferase [Candidatus Omnitrophota bacterium]
MNIAILASGRGSNFQAIVRAVKERKIREAKVKLLITDKEDAYVRIRAKRLGVKDIFVDPKKFKTRQDFDREIVKILNKERIELVVLAGFMRILTPYFVRKFKNRVLNIHPALLPAFKGTDVIQRAYNYGVKVTGVTIHFVDEKVDHGPIVMQKALEIKEGESLEELEERIHRLEHKMYPEVISLFIKGKLKIRGRHVKII